MSTAVILRQRIKRRVVPLPNTTILLYFHSFYDTITPPKQFLSTSSSSSSRCSKHSNHNTTTKKSKEESSTTTTTLSSPTTTTTTTTISKKGYRSIGSFHSENPEELMQLSDNDYIPPSLPFVTTITNDNDDVLYKKKKEFWNDDFLLDNYYNNDREESQEQKWTFLNHGAFGGALDVGIVRANEWRRFLELQPLRYFDRDLLPHLVHSARLLTQFALNGKPPKQCHYKSMALVPNVTTALNAILGGHARYYNSSFVKQQKDGKNKTTTKKKKMVLFFDVSYGSVKKMARHYYSHDDNNVAIVEIPFQEKYLGSNKRELRKGNNSCSSSTKQSMTALFEEALSKTLTDIDSSSSFSEYTLENSLLILDEVTSNTALKMPIHSLTKIAKVYGVQVLVDGAHGLLANCTGDILKTMEEEEGEGIDYYVSNCHKWMSSPRGAAMMYCFKDDLRESVLRYPPVMSHGVDDGYLSRFLWDGCRDYTAQLSLPAVIDYWNKLGPENVRFKMQRGMKQAVNILKESWHPSMDGVLLDINSTNDDGNDDASTILCESGITIAPMSMYSTSMALVRLPDGICGNEYENELDYRNTKKTSTDAKTVQDFLYNHKIEVPVKCINGVLYVRISYHIYNREEEYERLGDVMKQFSP